MEDVDILRRISLYLLSLNKILKNSIPGKVACIWHIEWIQIDAIKFERTQIHFFLLTSFSLLSSSSLFKVPTFSIERWLGRIYRINYIHGSVITKRHANTEIYFDRACLHEGGGQQVGEVTRSGGVKKITFLYMYSYNPPSRGVLSQDYWMVARFVNKKNADKPRVLASVLFYTHLLLLLQPSML